MKNSKNSGELFVASVSEALKVNRGIRSLNLSFCPAGFTGSMALGGALQVNNTLKKLVLTNCGLDDSMTMKIAQGIAANTTLESLRMTCIF